MDGMIDAPDTFRPGGSGETTRQLIDRITTALAGVPRKGSIIIITHGGPIACARATQLADVVEMIPDLVPSTGSVTLL